MLSSPSVTSDPSGGSRGPSGSRTSPPTRGPRPEGSTPATSASRVVDGHRAGHPLQARLQGPPRQGRRDPSSTRRYRTAAPARAGAIRQSRVDRVSVSQSVSDSSSSASATPVGADDRVDQAPQVVEGDELLRGDALTGKPLQRREDVVAALLERADRPYGGGRGVVDLVGETGGEGAEGDEGLALAGVGLDPASRADQPAQQVTAKGDHARRAERAPGPGAGRRGWPRWRAPTM